MSSPGGAPPDNWWDGLEVVQLIGDSAYGGGVPVVLGIMEACASIGLRPVLLASNPDVVRAAETRGLVVWELPGIVRKPQPLRDLRMAVRLAKELRSRDVRIVHTHTSKGGMVGRLGAWLAGCRLVIHHTHGFYHLGLPAGIARSSMETLERFFALLGDFQVFLNPAEADLAVSRHIVPASKVRIIPNGIVDPLLGECPQRDELLSEWGLPEDAILVGTVARLDIAQKGLDTGVRAFGMIAERHPRARYVIAGKGHDEVVLARMISEAGLQDRVRLIGHRDDAARLPSVFDVCLSPSVREGQSIAVLEAMACARPIVATRITGNSGLVEHEESALLCRPGDAEDMGRAVDRLLRDSVLAARLGEHARQVYTRQFTRDAFIERTRAAYLDMLGATSSGVKQ